MATVPASGVVLFTNLKNVFGGSNPVLLSQYYSNSSTQYTSNVSGIPATGNLLKISHFAGKAKALSRTLTSITFTNAGATGPNGPSLANLQTAYTGISALSNVSLYNNLPGYQLWTLPYTTTYTIKVAGARGGLSISTNAGILGGSGGLIQFSYNLQQGDQLIISIGQTPNVVSFGNGGAGGGGGGGGTFVVLRRSNVNSLLAIGAGGGGAGSVSSSGNGQTVTVTQNESNASVLTRDHYTVGASYAASTSGSTNPKSWFDGLTGQAVNGSFGGGGGGSYWGNGGGGAGYNGGNAAVGGLLGGAAGTNFVSSNITSYTVGNSTSNMGYVNISYT